MPYNVSMNRQHSTVWLLMRSMLPSFASLLWCFFGSCLVAAGGAFIVGLHTNASLLGVGNGELRTFYASSIVHPLANFLKSPTWGHVVIIGVWVLVSITAFSFCEALIHALVRWREASHDVQVVDEQTVISHPLQRSFLTYILWRLCVSAAGVLFVIVAQPLIRHTSSAMHRLVTAHSVHAALQQFMIAALIWTLILHVFTVLLRLYTLRTRLFGDPIIYQ